MDSATTQTFGRPGSRLLQGRYTDFAIALTLAIVTGLLVNWLYGHVAAILAGRSAEDVWFDSDVTRVFQVMTNRFSEMHYRVKVHPLHSLLTYPPAWALKQFLGPELAIRVITVGLAATWSAAMYALLRLIGCLRPDAALFCLLGTSASAFVFWASVPETYTLGSITILGALALCAWTLRANRSAPLAGSVLASAATLSVTITNWMVGLLVTFASNSWSRAIRITLMAFGLVSMLWGLEKFMFPHAVYFLGDSEEQRYMFVPGVQRLMQVLVSVLSTTIVAPEIGTARDNAVNWTILSFQKSMPGKTGLLELTGVVLWFGVLIAGVAGLRNSAVPLRFRIVVVLALAGQVFLHLLYGEETFLYSMHFLPLLLALAAFGTMSRFRVWSVSLTALLIPVLLASNLTRFAAAHERVRSPRQELLQEMQRRPEDVWPRGSGRLPLAVPGSELREKAYHEPGGGFSPAFGTFGIGIWLRDEDGSLAVADSRFSIEQLKQSLTWSPFHQVPGIKTTTDSYEATWLITGPSTRRLEFKNHDPLGRHSELVIRGPGPAGGPIYRLSWDGETLLVDGRWVISFQSVPVRVVLGSESDPGWKDIVSGPDGIEDPSGWAFARVEMGAAAGWIADVREAGEPALDLGGPPIGVGSVLQLPDGRFADSLNAQIAHILMATEGDELRPGDPAEYPLAWMRDAAYEIVALVRAGQLEAATRLAAPLADSDYFGGFGAEADAPGLSIWALMSVADQRRSAEFDRWLWPRVNRKAGDIVAMHEATSNIYRSYSGPTETYPEARAEATLVAGPVRDGLIQGRMDNHRPLLFVNAVSYRGLLDASRLAQRMGEDELANSWRERAQQIRDAWRIGLHTAEAKNERTLISALWPTWIGGHDADALRELLSDELARSPVSGRPDAARPDWTYFDIASAHQWLFLAEADVAWQFVEWYWNHQASPGLYTWWEGHGTGDAAGPWNNAMAWARPEGTTPHYWTAAEMALLQLDMLAYLDESADEPVLVIGAGVPAAWLDGPLHADGLRLGAGSVGWSWDGKQVRVHTSGLPPLRVRLGAAFPKDAMLRQDPVER